MSFSFRKPLRWLAWTFAVLLVLALGVTGWAWWRMRASLPPLDGTITVAGLSAPVQIERDALGVPTITGTSRADVARALGFLHAQDRFFQMDLLRRSGAGELSELFGPAAVPLDRSHRLHQFRTVAGKALALMPAEQRTVLDAYTAGVNAGLAALPRSPWEYVLLRTTPRAWRAEDSLLVAYAMWFDLQDASGRLELSLQAMRDALGQTATDFFAPRGNSWDAALDGSQFPEPALPRLVLEAPPATTAQQFTTEKVHIGSSSLAVAGRHGRDGAAYVANDMHLNLNLPHIWYRAVMRWTDAAGTAHRLAGVTLPGIPSQVVGSNGSIAWGYTNSYVDTMDVVTVEVESIAQTYYRTPNGFVEIERRPEIIQVKGENPVTLETRWTEWGPIIGGPVNNRFQALRWNAHDPESTNLATLDLELATSVEEAVQVAHRMGMPNQNIVIADRGGQIAWTVTGRIPKRVGFDGRYPVSWAYGDRRWNGWLTSAETPVISNPADGTLSTANQRLVGGEAYAKLGDYGYDSGPRGGQLRDDLHALVKAGKPVAPADLLGIMLDDRALFLARWQELLLATLSDEAVARKPARGELREAVRQWNGRASIDSAAYLLVRSFRSQVARETLEPFIEPVKAIRSDLDFRDFLYEDAVWRLTHERPAKLLNLKYASWDDLLLAAADGVIARAGQAGKSPADYTWGSVNELRMRHPFSRVLPGIFSSVFDMPVQPLPGDSDMPRVQSPGFGQSERLVVSPGREEEGLFHMPGGQSGNPLSPYYRAGHQAWVNGEATPLLPGATVHTLVLQP